METFFFYAILTKIIQTISKYLLTIMAILLTT